MPLKKRRLHSEKWVLEEYDKLNFKYSDFVYASSELLFQLNEF